MMLTTADQGIVGIKSNVLDLSSYRGKQVIVRGSVVDIINNIPVLNASSIVSGDETDTAENTTDNESRYVAAAGLVLHPENLSNYTIKNIGSDSITFASGDQEVQLSYFACTNDKSATSDCAHVMKQFASASSRFTGVDGDEWVQLPETRTRFGSNDNRIGYRIMDVDKAVVTDLLNGIVFVNDRFVSKRVMGAAKDACQTIDHVLNYVVSTDVSYTSSDSISITINGTDTKNNNVKCTVSVDPRTPNDVKLVNIADTGTTAADTQDENTSDATTTDTDTQNTTETSTTAQGTGENTDPAPQNHIPLPFTSVKGYTIIFPSSDIAFQGINNDKSLGIDGVAGCWTQMNVVGFSNAEHVIDNPAIIMYDCRDVKATIGALNGYIRKDGSKSDKTFFIKVVNPAWKSFAESIKVE